MCVRERERERESECVCVVCVCVCVCGERERAAGKKRDAGRRTEKNSSSQVSSADAAARQALIFFCEITNKCYHVGSWRPDACALSQEGGKYSQYLALKNRDVRLRLSSTVLKTVSLDTCLSDSVSLDTCSSD